MKNVRNALVALTLLFILMLTSCASPTPETVLVVVTATGEASTQVPTAEPIATMEPLQVAGPESGELMKWLDNSTLVYIPAGEFSMGDSINSLKHTVSLSGYWIHQTKVTNRMYEQCVKAGVCATPTQELGGPVYGNPEYASHPVVGVNWEQAQTYCTWIQGSLPTEAQWEKAATNGNVYPWGNANPSCDLLNFANCYGRTTNVNAYKNGTSPFGVFDMAGNVFEWVSDWYDVNYYTQSPAEDPTGPQSGQYRVIRGSSFETATEQIVSAIRRFDEPIDSRRDTGFRCAVNNPQPFAPYCQLNANVAISNQNTTIACTLPEGVVTNQYCQQGDGYATLQISFEATWDERGTRIQCKETIEGGLRTLTCVGPRGFESTNEVVVCNPACSPQSTVSGLTPLCDSGYTFDSNANTCVYSPIAPQANTGGCPIGYVTKESGGVQFCVASLNAGGSCPIGLYFDDVAQACVPPNGQTNAPFGINDAALATQIFAGCAAGYSYNEGFQCCQPNAGNTFPSCAPGTTFDLASAACVPVTEIALGGEGCITVRVNTFKCSTVEDSVCAPILTESRCVAEISCKWNEKAGLCERRTSP